MSLALSRRGLAVGLVLAVLAALLSLSVSTAEAHKRKAYRVTASGNTAAVTLGGAVKVRGKVRPKARHQRVSVQELINDTWTTVSTKKLTKKSKYKATFFPSNAGAVQYRVCKSAFRRVAAGCSAPSTVSVFQWRYLHDLDSIDDENFYREDPLAINGTSYKKSLRGSERWDEGGTDFVEYNLSRRCTAFRATVGIADMSESGAAGQLEILTDGNSVYNQSFALGQSAAVSFDVSNALRIRFESTTDRNDLSEYVGIGSPQAYCSF